MDVHHDESEDTERRDLWRVDTSLSCLSTTTIHIDSIVSLRFIDLCVIRCPYSIGSAQNDEQVRSTLCLTSQVRANRIASSAPVPHSLKR
jgi:hypothetical protein